jgi:FkbM family methyltransferase
MIDSWIVGNLDRNCIIIEAGMYDGKNTDFFCRYFCDGMVYGFEPVPEPFAEANNRLSKYENVVLYEKALAENTGFRNMFYSDRFGEHSGSSSILPPKDHLSFHPEITFKEFIQIETITLDDWANQNSITKIDLMWLDTQGSEPIILGASKDTLSKTRYLYTEVSLIETYSGVIMYPEFKAFLEDNNFEVVFEDLPWKDMGNVLYKNNALD